MVSPAQREGALGPPRPAVSLLQFGRNWAARRRSDQAYGVGSDRRSCPDRGAPDTATFGQTPSSPLRSQVPGTQTPARSPLVTSLVSALVHPLPKAAGAIQLFLINITLEKKLVKLVDLEVWESFGTNLYFPHFSWHFHRNCIFSISPPPRRRDSQLQAGARAWHVTRKKRCPVLLCFWNTTFVSVLAVFGLRGNRGYSPPQLIN